ncbi:hypothetical protein M9H77_08007 [Catharanthus roseus]|uniref:Uncharacterized protein n=1 Tax=Catharanthus roseus TaxID=4058 RepID=A0ACC0BWS4_CATRO|nr:hypothetical protein M9H77_08007 [Catharanthus roseus]
MEQRVGDNFRGINSPYHQRSCNNMSTQGYHDMSAHSHYPFHEGGFQGRPQVRGGRKGGQGGRGYYRPHEEVPRHEAWHEDNLFEDFGEDPNVGHAYHGGYYGNQQGDKALNKIKWKLNVVPKPQALTYKSWPKKKDTPKVAFKYHSKYKVEEKEG